MSLRVHGQAVLLRDVGQSLSCMRMSSQPAGDTKHVAPTVMPNQLMLTMPASGQVRLLLGEESLLVHGFPTRQFVDHLESLPKENAISNSAMADIAGNMVPTTVLASMTLSAILATSWRKKAHAASAPGSSARSGPSEDDVSAALNMFALCAGSSNVARGDDACSSSTPDIEVKRIRLSSQRDA